MNAITCETNQKTTEDSVGPPFAGEICFAARLQGWSSRLRLQSKLSHSP
jgi:hypothetical protein